MDRALKKSLNVSRVTTTCLSCRAGFGNIADDAASELGSDSVLNSQSGSGPGVATVTEQQQQQQQFVQQMLQALANSNYGVFQCFLINMLSASLIDWNLS